MKYLLWVLPILLVLTFPTFGQRPINSLPKNYFQSPLSIPLRIISNFGSFRENHFHSGLDLNTGGKEGLAVLASGPGYISRIKIQSGGYGKAIYITHPNGWVSVYAHLNRFSPKIEEKIDSIQTQSQVFELDIHFQKGVIPIEKGEKIALSGNTGNTGGPHLHFEIRDEKSEEIYNPLLFGLPIKDEIPPKILGIYLYQANLNSLNSYIKIAFVPCIKGKLRGTFPRLSLNQPYFLGIIAEDYSFGAKYPGTNYSIQLIQEKEIIFSSEMSHFGFDQTRSINSYLDYEPFKFHHQKIQRLLIEPNNPLKIYNSSDNHWILSKSKRIQSYKIEIGDAYDNHTFLDFSLQFEKDFSALPNPIGKEKILVWNQSYFLGSDHLNLFIPANSFFDNIPMPKIQFSGNQVMIGNPLIPVKDSMLLEIELAKSKFKKQYYLSKDMKALEGNSNSDSLRVWIKEFGNYTLKIDSIKPYVHWEILSKNPSIKPSQEYYFKIGDHESGLKYYSLYLDGIWTKLEYDSKFHSAHFIIPKGLKNGKHELKIKLQDQVENQLEEKLFLYY